MSANPDQLTANGRSSSVITATLRDANGQTLAGITIHFDLTPTGSGVFADLGVIARLNSDRPVPGGPRRHAVSAVTNGNGVAKIRYWSPFRTDSENDASVTITGRPAGRDFNAAILRSVNIFLRAANRPIFPGSGSCGISVEPTQPTYSVGQGIFFTATQAVGVARYEWDFGDGTVGPPQRNVSHVYDSTGTFSVTLTQTSSTSGLQSSCGTSIIVD
jgi:hypothetical protein